MIPRFLRNVYLIFGRMGILTFFLSKLYYSHDEKIVCQKQPENNFYSRKNRKEIIYLFF